MKNMIRLKMAALVLLFGFMAMPAQSAENVEIILQASKPYGEIISQIEALGGTVRMQYKNIDALAATVPMDKMEDLQAISGVGLVRKDRQFTREDRQLPSREGYGVVANSTEINLDQLAETAPVDYFSNAPDGYFPSDVALTGAGNFWNATGHFGEGVIVGIMDSGTADVAAIAGRVIGGESFLSASPFIDDGLGPNSPFNGSHGTWVATTLGANVGFLFSSSSGFVQAIKRYLPDAVVPFAPGIDLVPMVGPAPEAEFFALKIFNRFGQTTNSVILAGFDRAIELKTKYDNGQPGGVNLQVINGSFGGATLNSADDPFFAGMVQDLTNAGIVTVFSASNDGPSGMTIGDPALARNTLTVGATNPAAYEKILRDLQFGPGIGAGYRANNTHQTAEFSGRGPTSDGRCDPDITAPGFAIFAQSASGGLNVVSGTSFSSPMVAGAAALLLSAHPGATPDQIRGALLHGANPNVLDDNPTQKDQGYGFLDVLGAYDAWGASNPPDQGLESMDVAANIHNACDDGRINLVQSNTHYREVYLKPGETIDYYLDTDYKIRGYTITVSVTPQLPPSQQNPFFGDDVFLNIHNAWTSGWNAYLVSTFTTGATINLPESALDFGLMRVTLSGDWTNAGDVKASILIQANNESPSVQPVVSGTIGQGDSDFYLVPVSEDKSNVDLALVWDKDWGAWPTNDLDLIIYRQNPSGTFGFFGFAAGLGTPEKLNVASMPAGNYLFEVNGFTVWNGSDNYTLYSNLNDLAKLNPGEGDNMIADVPETFEVSDNYPNPFNPSTSFRYQLPEAVQVSAQIFDISGKLVRTLVDARQSAGYYTAKWDGRNSAGSQVASGSYYMVLRAGENLVRKNMMLLK